MDPEPTLPTHQITTSRTIQFGTAMSATSTTILLGHAVHQIERLEGVMP
jgi:hypothetical protein